MTPELKAKLEVGNERVRERLSRELEVKIVKVALAIIVVGMFAIGVRYLIQHV